MNFYIKIYNFVTSSKSKRLLSVLWRGWFGDRKGIRPAKTWVLVRWWGWCDWALQILWFWLPWCCHLHHVFCSKIQEGLTFSYLLTLIVKKTGWWTDCMCQWCGLRPSVLGQDRSETKRSVLVFQVWCCVVKHGLVSHTRPHNDLEGYSNLSSTIYGFSILLLHHLQWRSTVAFTYLKVKSAKCLCLLLVVLVLDLFTSLVCVHGSSFGRTPFLMPSMTHMGDSKTRTWDTWTLLCCTDKSKETPIPINGTKVGFRSWSRSLAVRPKP